MYTSGFLKCIRDAAGRLGLTVEVVDKANGRVIRVCSASGGAAFFGATPVQLWPLNNALSVSVARDKELTLRLLKEAGICVPDTVIAFQDAERYAHLDPPPACTSTFVESPPLEFPVVVKPNDSLAGNGLSFVYEPTSLAAALRCAASHSNGVLVQELLCGKDVRIYGYRGRGILRIERGTRSVPADGCNTTAALLADFPAETEQARLSLGSFIAQYGNQVFPAGQRISPYPAANYCVTGRVGEMSRELSDEERAICRTVYTSLDLVFCAIDCLVDKDGSVRVLEVNGNPGIEMLYSDSENEAAVEVIDFLVKEAIAGSLDNAGSLLEM